MVKKNKNKNKDNSDKLETKGDLDDLFKSFKKGSKSIKKSEPNDKKPSEETEKKSIIISSTNKNIQQNDKEMRKKMKKERKEIENSSKPAGTCVDGTKLYSEEELGMNKAGSGETADCPFDCECCF